MSPPELEEVLISLASAALQAAEADAKTNNLIFRDEWKFTPRTRKSTSRSWFIPVLEKLDLIQLLRSMKDPFTSTPAPEPAAASTPSASAPRPSSAANEPSSQASPKRPPQPRFQGNAVEKLIKDNKDVYDRLINHPFPQALGDGSASLDGFRYYMIQDTYYLQNCANVKMATAAQSDNYEKDIKTFNQRHKSSLNYVNSSVETLASMLGVPEKNIFDTPPNETIQASRNHYMTSVQNTNEDSYLAYYVVLLPCILSYWEISNRLALDNKTVKSVVYHPAWIEVNNDDSSAKKYTKFINENIWAKGGVGRWNDVFRKACELEIKVFDTGLPPTPRPYLIVPNGTYFVQSSSAAGKVVLANQSVESFLRLPLDKRLGAYFPSDPGSSVFGINKTGGDNERWRVVATKDGYSFQNVGTGHYLGVATGLDRKVRNLQAVVEPYYWWINPVKNQPSKERRLFQIYETVNLRYRLHADKEILKLVNQTGSLITPIISYQDSELEGPCQMWSFELDQNMAEFIVKYEQILREKFEEIEQSREECTEEIGQKLLTEAKDITVTSKNLEEKMSELFKKYELVLGEGLEAIERQRREHNEKKRQELLEEAQEVTDSEGRNQMAELFARYERTLKEEFEEIEKWRKKRDEEARGELLEKVRKGTDKMDAGVTKKMAEFKWVGKYEGLLRENVEASGHLREQSDEEVREELLAEAGL